MSVVVTTSANDKKRQLKAMPDKTVSVNCCRRTVTVNSSICHTWIVPINASGLNNGNNGVNCGCADSDRTRNDSDWKNPRLTASNQQPLFAAETASK